MLDFRDPAHNHFATAEGLAFDRAGGGTSFERVTWTPGERSLRYFDLKIAFSEVPRVIEMIRGRIFVADAEDRVRLISPRWLLFRHYSSGMQRPTRGDRTVHIDPSADVDLWKVQHDQQTAVKITPSIDGRLVLVGERELTVWSPPE